MLYVFIMDDMIRVSSIHPDTEDNEKLLVESFIAFLPDSKKIPLDIQQNIIRNVLTNSGATVTLC